MKKKKKKKKKKKEEEKKSKKKNFHLKGVSTLTGEPVHCADLIQLHVISLILDNK